MFFRFSQSYFGYCIMCYWLCNALSGDKKLGLLDKGFVSAKEYKKNSNLTKITCYKTGEENQKRVFLCNPLNVMNDGVYFVAVIV